MEIPVTIGQQPGVLSLVISPDEDNQDPEKKKKKNWRVQFAVNASVIGEVGAEVGLLGDRTNVVLSAAEPETAQALDADVCHHVMIPVHCHSRCGAFVQPPHSLWPPPTDTISWLH